MVQNNRRRKNTATMQQAIEPGVRVMTTSGIYGIVQEVEPDSIVIEISEGVDVRFAKAAVMRVVADLVDETEDDDLDDDADGSGQDDETPEVSDEELHAELDALGSERPADEKKAAPRADGHEGAA
jgi:preprotein translocase subunit YajC